MHLEPRIEINLDVYTLLGAWENLLGAHHFRFVPARVQQGLTKTDKNWTREVPK